MTYTSGNTTQPSQQFLTFILSGEEYGVDILVVQELRGWELPTRIPNVPSFVLGVINLRGLVVPIVDLRQRFGMPTRAYGTTTVVIVIRQVIQECERVIGLVVDAVSEVYAIDQEQMQPPPDMDGAISSRFVTGLATMDEGMIILLDINTLMNEGILSHTGGQDSYNEGVAV